jgi:hypothetical protein
MISHESVLDKLEDTARELEITDIPCWWTWKRLHEMTSVEWEAPSEVEDD